MISGVTLLLQATDFCEIALINNCTGDVTESSTGTHPSSFRQPKERDPGLQKMQRVRGQAKDQNFICCCGLNQLRCKNNAFFGHLPATVWDAQEVYI